MQQAKIVSNIISERSFFMGIAILLIVLYHTPSGCVPSIVKKMFYPGFVGVDFFLFYSAYGLSFSIGKWTVKAFYMRRFSRILPLFLILALSKSLLYVVQGNNLSVFDWICNLTTLSYYGIGGFVFDWYLCVLLLLYILFPLIKKGTIRCLSMVGKHVSGVQWIVILFLLAMHEFPWQYETAIARIPVFTLGILCACDNKNYMHALISFTIIFPVSVLLLFKGLIHTYCLVYLLAPLILFLLTFLFFEKCNITKYKVYQIICFLGSITLELYVANNIALSMMSFTPLCVPRLFSYILINITLASFLVYLNKLISKKNNIWQKSV